MNFTTIAIIGFLCLPIILSMAPELIRDLFMHFKGIHHKIIFGCQIKELFDIMNYQYSNQLSQLNHFTGNITNLKFILNPHYYAPTVVIVDYSCSSSKKILEFASDNKFFNTTYQWIIFDDNNSEAIETLNNSMNVGLNAQIIFVNKTENEVFQLYDIYSKGRHLGDSLNVTYFGQWSIQRKLKVRMSVSEMRGIKHRGQFNLLKLRGVIVNNLDNITNNAQLQQLYSLPDFRAAGIQPISKYHFELVKILGDRLNFSIEYRNSRGWAGRLPNSTYRLGLFGITQRNEADVAASPSFFRFSRLRDLDFVHQSWLFETSFVYLYTSHIQTSAGGGNFLAPFDFSVWIVSLITLVIIVILWKFFEIIAVGLEIAKSKHHTFGNVLLHSIAAICQQGLDPPPLMKTSRITVLTLITFSLLMYNYYTSSVVGGLLSTSDQGPKNLEQLVQSPLTLSFEDIGYNKIVVTEPTTREVIFKIRENLKERRSPDDLPQFSSRALAIPFIKKGTHAFHCEVAGIYTDIARVFDANEICNLRTMKGLLPFEVVGMIITKKSQYLEMFRIILARAKEIGIIKRIIKQTRSDRPICQGGLTVLPVAMRSLTNAFLMLAGGILMSTIILGIEILWYKRQMLITISFN